MSAAFRFEADERPRVERAFADAVAAAESAGLSLSRPGPLHARYHRWLVARIRSATGTRPRHGEVAARLLEWSRGLGRVELFALCPVAHAIAEAHGESGIAVAARRLPSLAEAHALRDGPASLSRDSAGGKTAA